MARFICILLCLVAAAGYAVSQSYRAAPIAVKRSTFIEDVKAIRVAKPNAPAQQIADAANALLDSNGINFAISFDSATCDRLRKVKEQQKDPKAPLAIGAMLKSVEADAASLALPDPQFPPGACGCYIELPLLQMTDADFIAVISGQNIRFHLPSNLHTFAALLVEPNDHAKIKGRWRIPFRGIPIGVSHDENVLYLAFREPELADLSFAVFREGVFQVATRAEAEKGGKGQSLKSSTPGSGNMKIQFDRWGKSLVVEYLPPCS